MFKGGDFMENKELSEVQLQLELDVFEGPLDLLLHLINKLEIDIYDIPIAKITSQYLEYLERMKTNKINLAGEYFVMAASLMRIKSEMLVPRNENQAEIIEDYYMEEDPRKDLIQLLLEYRQIKEVVPKFEDRQTDRADYFGKEPTELSAYREKIELEDQGLEISDLTAIFHEVLARHKLDTPQPTTIQSDEVTVTEKMDTIYSMLSRLEGESLSFFDLINKSNRQEIVVSFLAILELIKDNRVLVKQESMASDILVTLNNDMNEYTVR